MTVKVMLAPAIATGDLPPGRTARPAGASPRPRRRRSAVYDADGNEVFITLMCLKCHKMRPLAQFGLRRMADGAIRNQPWCRTCRSGAGAEKPRKRAASAEVVAAEAQVAPAADSKPPVPAGTVAAQVAAALAGGWDK
jgi:hypothetical protein